LNVPTAGQRICNRYVLESRIGSGGHGEIWSAIDEHDGQTVALKFLREDLAASVEAWAILNHESQMARRLNHPGILRTGTPIRDGERTVLPMEFAGGGDLKRLRGQSYLRSVPVLIRIAEILSHAHARGVVHRDLKPGNVLFDGQGAVRLTDFGAAGLSGTRHSHAQGSPFSASPQQLQDLPAAPADDIYGLGALAYELLSGQPPRMQNGVVPEMAPAQALPAPLTALVMRMLDAEPAARPATMHAVIEGLNQALSDTLAVDGTAGLPVLPSLSTLPVAESEIAPAGEVHVLRAERREPPRQRTSSVGLVTGVLVVAVAAAAGWWWQRDHGPVRAAERSATTPAPGSAPAAAPAVVPDAVLAPEPVVQAVIPGDAQPAEAPAAVPAESVPPRSAEYERRLARGNEALQAHRYTDAREAFEAARKLDPAAAEPAAALEQIDAELAAQDYEALKTETASLETQERWREAHDAYQRALQADPALRFAQQGAERTALRVELGDRLDDYLQRPEQLASPAARDDARRWVERARVLVTGPVLRSQVDRVELLLGGYGTP
jgi:serine/threonine-protein kinase